MMLVGLFEGGAQHANLRLKAEESEVPENVVESFRTHYDKASDATWTIISSSLLQEEFGIREKRKGEKSTYYEVAFSTTDGNREVVYDHFGGSVGVKKVIATSSLPSPVKKTVHDFIERDLVISAEEVSERGGPAYFMIVINQDGQLQPIIVRASGEVVK